MESKTVLFVEDAPDLISLYRLAFRGKPYPTRFATRGEQALQQIKEDPNIGLVLLDLTLPDMDGQEVLASIREQNLPLQVVVMSGWDDLKEKARRMGADGHIRKPVTIPDLETAVDKLLAGL
jgi:CheY-like chemotaxis protein